MPHDPAQGVSRLFAVTPDSPAQLLHLLTELAAARAAGCAGATASLWELDEVAATAASHPELADIVERQVMIGDGPIIAALRRGEPSVMADTLHEDRWPDSAAAALAAGVRASATVTHEYEPLTLTLSLYGVRPQAFDGDQLPLASLLAMLGTGIAVGMAQLGKARRAAAQLEEAIQTRAVVDQAKGVLVQALGCDPDEAFRQMRRISQTQHIKLAEVAGKLMKTRAGPVWLPAEASRGTPACGWPGREPVAGR